jgi:hypothetical protein
MLIFDVVKVSKWNMYNCSKGAPRFGCELFSVNEVINVNKTTCEEKTKFSRRNQQKQAMISIKFGK